MIPMPARLSLLLCAAISTACASADRPAPMPVPIPEVREIRTDPALLACEPEPDPPPSETDHGTFLDWVETMRVAGRDCRSKLACIARQQRGEPCRLAE